MDCKEILISEFPLFFFNEEICNNINITINITEKEKELLGLILIYGKNVKDSKDISYLPYEYIKEIGAFNVLKLKESLDEKLNTKAYLNGNYCQVKDFIIKGLLNGEFSFVFNEFFYKININDYLLICEEIFKIYNNENRQNIMLIKDDSFRGCSTMFKTCDVNIHNWAKRLTLIQNNDNKYLISDGNICRTECILDGYKCFDNIIYTDLEVFPYLTNRILNKLVEIVKEDNIYLKLTEKGEEFLDWYNTYVKNVDFKIAEYTKEGKILAEIVKGIFCNINY